ncbi:MAG: hypothetical protein IK132_11805 [Clostridia bacterium]|nr:hypothetical protein [Clostridia bacterium]
MQKEITYDQTTLMKHGFPKIKKLGAVSPYGESSPFVFNDRLYRLELVDTHRPTNGLDPSLPIHAIIRDRETGEILSRFGEGCYYYSLYQENGTVYVIGTKSLPGLLAGDGYRLFESCDLLHWTSRDLLSRPGWRFYNSSLTRGPAGYVLCMESDTIGVPFTCFFATSPDMIHWTYMEDSKGYPLDRYCGGPWMRYSRGYYYLIIVTCLPGARYTNYVCRTKDFETWELGFYNPLLMPDEDDRRISPYMYDISPELLEQIRTGFIASNSDVDLCDWKGKTLISYNVGNQLGFYYMAEAEYDGTLDDFLEAFFA